MRVVIVGVALFGLMGCSDGPGGPSSISIHESSFVLDLFYGDTLHLEVRPDVAPDEVDWEVDEPSAATISSDGVLTVTTGIETDVTIRATHKVSGASDTERISTDGWSTTEETDDISGQREIRADLPSALGPDGSADGINRLFLRCADGQFELYISTSFITAHGGVRYRFDDTAPVSATWNEATSYQAYFYPGNARDFAAYAAQKDSLIFEGTEYGNGTHVGWFPLYGLSEVLPQFPASC